MMLELTIQQMFDENPMKFKERSDCLNQLFCVVGNGYQWVNGELVEISRTYTAEEIAQLESHLVDGKAFQHNKMSIQAELIYTFETSMKQALKDFENSVELRRAMNKHIEMLRSQYPDDVYHEYPRKERWDYSKLPYWAKYAKLVNYPENIKEDWMAGLEECKTMLREDGFNV